MSEQAPDWGRRTMWFSLVAIVAVFGYLAVTEETGTDGGPSEAEKEAAIAETRSELGLDRDEVIYYVRGEGTRSADITYRTAGGTEQQQDVDVPLKSDDGDSGLSVTLDQGGFAYISAQRQEDGSGAISCAIEVDGEVVVQNRSSGPYSIVTCSTT